MIKYFICNNCGTKFAQYIDWDKPYPICPKCGSYNVREITGYNIEIKIPETESVNIDENGNLKD